jgi:hypothetical protein
VARICRLHAKNLADNTLFILNIRNLFTLHNKIPEIVLPLRPLLHKFLADSNFATTANFKRWIWKITWRKGISGSVMENKK